MVECDCPVLNLRKNCTDLFDKASLKMVLGCILAGLANHALYVHRPALSDGHILGLMGKFCQTATYRYLSIVKGGDSNCV